MLPCHRIVIFCFQGVCAFCLFRCCFFSVHHCGLGSRCYLPPNLLASNSGDTLQLPAFAHQWSALSVGGPAVLSRLPAGAAFQSLCGDHQHVKRWRVPPSSLLILILPMRSLTINRVRVWRNGQALDRLEPQELRIFQREADLEHFSSILAPRRLI